MPREVRPFIRGRFLVQALSVVAVALRRLLKPGDVVELEIEGIGVLRNRVVRPEELQRERQVKNQHQQAGGATSGQNYAHVGRVTFFALLGVGIMYRKLFIYDKESEEAGS
jgi:hypothetical protein